MRWIVAVVLLGCVLLGVVLFVRWYLAIVPSPGESPDIAWYVRKAEQWNVQSRVLRSVQVALAIVAIVASVLSASQWKPPWMPGGSLAVLAAVSIALLTGLDLTGQANKTRNAARHLTISILEHGQSSGPTSLAKVLDAYREAENLVGDYSPNVSGR
jgi:hypothetical protein